MPDPSLRTTQLQNWVARMQAGDKEARDELLRSVAARLARLARKMLRGFPAVGRWTQTDDVLQNALMRLMRALESVQPHSTREFYGLAAKQIRRELLDLSRHFYGPLGKGANHASQAGQADSPTAPPDPAETLDDPADIEKWSAFHDAVEGLPAQEREVVGLIFYHGWTQAEVAALLQVDVRTVQRYWLSARLALREALKGEIPG